MLAALVADPTVDLSVPVMASLAMREGLRTAVLPTLKRGDYHPAVGDVPGTLTYRAGGQTLAVSLSPETELLLAAYMDR